jgi:hypothetical protein
MRIGNKFRHGFVLRTAGVASATASRLSHTEKREPVRGVAALRRANAERDAALIPLTANDPTQRGEEVCHRP